MNLIICLAILITALVQCNPADAAIRSVVIEEETAPGFDTGSVFYDLAGRTISINNSGQATFTANVKSGSTYYTTLWRQSSGTLSLINHSAETPPGTSGDVFFQAFHNPNINDAGMVAFVGLLQGNDVQYPTNDKGIWKGVPGSVSLVARTGDTAPGASGDTFGRTFAALGGGTVAFNNDGRVAFYNNLNNATTNNSVWQENASGLTMLAKTGAAVPGFANATYSDFNSGVVLNNNGDLAFFPGITETFDVWPFSKYLPLIQKAVNSSITTKYTGETAAPGVGGNTFQGFAGGGQNHDMNASGHLVFYAGLDPGGSVDQTNQTGIWSDASGSLALVARNGSQAPGTPAGTVFSLTNSPLVMNDAGQVAFGTGLLKTDKGGAGGVDNTNASGIWLETGGVLNLIARAGDRAPGTPDGVVFNTQFNYYAINNAGQVYFQTWLVGPGIDSSNSAGIWLYDPSGGVSLVVREGDDVTLTSGETVTFNDITISSDGTHTPCSGGSDGRVRHFNNNGEIAFKATVSPGSREGFFIANTSGSAPTKTLTAYAGSNQSAAEGNTVNLDASGSTATSSTIATYSWTQTDNSGITVTLSGRTKISATFTAPQVTSSKILTFALTITDNLGNTSTDSISITITDSDNGGDDDDDDDSSSCFISNLQQ